MENFKIKCILIRTKKFENRDYALLECALPAKGFFSVFVPADILHSISDLVGEYFYLILSPSIRDNRLSLEYVGFDIES